MIELLLETFTPSGAARVSRDAGPVGSGYITETFPLVKTLLVGGQSMPLDLVRYVNNVFSCKILSDSL